MTKPIEMTFTVSDILEAVQFWLNNKILKPEVKIKRVVWEGQTNIFRVEIQAEEEDK
jgi:hypothetical protein